MVPVQAEKSKAEILDCIIIGGGISGLRLGSELEQAGCSYRIFEAQSQIGGRIRTDTTTFSLPTELGATFPHGPRGNPLHAMAKKLNLGIFVPRDGGFYLDGRKATPAEERQLEALEEAFYEKVEASAARGEDKSLAEFLVGLPGAETAVGRFFTQKIGDLEGGLPAAELGSFDAGHFLSSSNDGVIEAGFSRVVEEIAKGVPPEKISLETPIQKVVVKEDGVEIHTKSGDVHRARSVRLSVSVGVLASGAIEFDPPLPKETVDAFTGLKMCRMELAHLELVRVPELEGKTEYHAETATLPALQYLYRPTPDGKTLAQAFLPGPTAQKYDGDPEALVALATAKLEETYGDKLTVLRGKATQWGTNPWTRGSYSVSGPDGARHRAVLRKSLFGGRLGFIGEATAMPQRNASAAGAYQSAGREAKRLVPWILRDRTEHPADGVVKAGPGARFQLNK